LEAGKGKERKESKERKKKDKTHSLTQTHTQSSQFEQQHTFGQTSINDDVTKITTVLLILLSKTKHAFCTEREKESDERNEKVFKGMRMIR